jgi:transcription elongation GreA/GreB family factor
VGNCWKRKILYRVGEFKASETVTHGALVKTSQGNFFIAISLGLVSLDQQKYFVVSPDSTIGKLLMGKKVGEVISWNGNEHKILAIE